MGQLLCLLYISTQQVFPMQCVLLIHGKAARADVPAASANLVCSALDSLEAEGRRRQGLSPSHMGLASG